MRYISFLLIITGIIISIPNTLYAPLRGENVYPVSRLWSVWDDGEEVIVRDDYAYVATGYSGLQIVDVSDPESLLAVGCCDEALVKTNGIFLSGSYAYMTAGRDGLRIIDISDPANPVETGFTLTGDYACDIHLRGDFAYVADSEGGLCIVDISDPENPQVSGYYFRNLTIKAVHIVGNRAYLLDVYDDYRVTIIMVVDISNPRIPHEIGSCWTEGRGQDIAVDGSYAYVLSSGAGMVVVDISDPTDPNIISRCDNVWGGVSITVSGSYAYITCQYWGDYYRGSRDNGGGDDPYGWLEVVDISDPENPEGVRGMGLGYFAEGIYLSGDHLFIPYVGYSGWLLSAVDVSDPEEPEVTDGMDYPGNFERIFISDEHAYLWENYYGWRGLSIVDIADPEDITVSYRNDTLEVRDMFVTDSVAYLATGDGLAIFGIHDPANPHQFETYKEPESFSSVHVSGNYLYMIYYDRDSSDYILEVANIFHTPDRPDSVGSYNLRRYIYRGKLTVTGDYAFVWRTGYNDISIIDVSDPEHPDSIGFIETDESVLDVNIRGDYLYMLRYEQELSVFDISEPGDVIQVGSLEIDEEYYERGGISVSGNLLYLICGRRYSERNLYIIDISDPTNPVEIGYYDTPGYGIDVAVSDGLIYVADWNNLGIYRFIHPEGVEPSDPLIPYPSSFILYPAYPNPFNSTTTITYSVPVASHISLVLYDLSGRKVMTLDDSHRQPGVYNMLLNGEGLSTGMYIIRMESPAGARTQKIVLVR